jgi:hypothetical protein
LLNAAGFAPIYPERSLDDPGLSAARQAIDLVLAGLEPNPALAVDRHWTLAAANRTVTCLLTGVDPLLPRPPVNVLRLSLHPAGLAPLIVNLAAWRAHLLERLRQQIEASADGVLIDLQAELRAYPAPAEPAAADEGRDFGAVAVLFRLATDGGVLSFLSTTTVAKTPIDITLSELALECFFPADTATAAALRGMAASG